MSERIDHAAEASKVAKPLVSDPYTSRETWLAEAQLHATLALVEQQRIANLIALSVGDWDHGQAVDALVVRPQMGADPYPLRPEIAAALGIEQGEER